VSTLKYLGRVLSSTDDDWPSIYSILPKARKRWEMVARVLTREGMVARVLTREIVTQRTSAIFQTAIVQSTLLYMADNRDGTDKVLRPWRASTTGWQDGFRAARLATSAVRMSGYIPRLKNPLRLLGLQRSSRRC
jgi:hypothetical protein